MFMCSVAREAGVRSFGSLEKVVMEFYRKSGCLAPLVALPLFSSSFSKRPISIFRCFPH